MYCECTGISYIHTRVRVHIIPCFSSSLKFVSGERLWRCVVGGGWCFVLLAAADVQLCYDCWGMVLPCKVWTVDPCLMYAVVLGIRLAWFLRFCCIYTMSIQYIIRYVGFWQTFFTVSYRTPAVSHGGSWVVFIYSLLAAKGVPVGRLPAARPRCCRHVWYVLLLSKGCFTKAVLEKRRCCCCGHTHVSSY